MRKYRTHILIALATLILFVGPVGVQVAYAQSSWALGLGGLVTGFFDHVALKIFGIILEWAIVPVFSLLMSITALLFDYTVHFTLNTCNYAPTRILGAAAGGECGIGAIDTGWILIRDLINISFIFIILYIAIQTIIGSTRVNTKKMLGGVIMAALLINFSMFIAAFIIDAGNLLATSLYNSIDAGGATSTLGTTPLSSAILSGIGVQGLYDVGAQGGTALILSAATRIIIFSILIVAFAMAAILFITRTVAFIFLLILSPFGFVGMFLPKLKEYSQKWWSELVKQTAVAPIFLFFMTIIIFFTQEAEQLFQQGGALSVETYAMFAMIIGLMIGAIKITKDLSGKVGSAALKVGGVVGGLALGGSAMLARKGLGAAATRAMGSARANQLRQVATDPTRGKMARFAARNTLRVGNKAETGTYDIRNITKTKAFEKTGLDKAVGKLSDASGISAGKGLKAGYKDNLEDKEKKEKKFEENVLAPRETADTAEYKKTGLYQTSKKQADATKAVKEAEERHQKAFMTLQNNPSTEAQNEQQEAAADLQKKKANLTSIEAQIQGAPQEERVLRDKIAQETGLRNKDGKIDPAEVQKYVEDSRKYTQQQYVQTLREQTNALGKVLNPLIRTITLGQKDLNREVKRLRTESETMSDQEKERIKQVRRTQVGSNKVSQRLADYLDKESSKSEEERKNDKVISRLEKLIKDASKKDADDKE